MKDSASDKIQKICDQLRKETLEPAQLEAQKILDEAKVQYDRIIAEARKEAEAIKNQAITEMAERKNVFESSLQQASKQVIDTLKKEVENKIFNDQIPDLVNKDATDPAIVAKIINAIVHALQKEGIHSDLVAYIPRTLDPKEVNKLLLADTIGKLKNGTVELGGFAGGAQVKLLDRKMTMDLSSEALAELFKSFLRKDFREMILL